MNPCAKGLSPEKCREVLQYCNENMDSQTCTLKLLWLNATIGAWNDAKHIGHFVWELFT
jgi:hypothetical protein